MRRSLSALHDGRFTLRVAKSAYLRRVLQVQDTLLALLCYLLFLWGAQSYGFVSIEDRLVLGELGVVVLLAGAVGARGANGRLHGITVVSILTNAFGFAVTVCGLVFLVDSLGRERILPDGFLQALLIALTLVMCVNRGFLKWWYLYRREEHPANFLRVLVIGSGPRAQRLVEQYQQNAEWRIQVVAMLDPEDKPGPNELGGIPVIRGLHEAGELLAEEVIDEAIVCLPRSLIDDISEVIALCEQQATCIRFMADLYDIPSKRMTLDYIGQSPVLTIEPIAQDEGKLVVKRVLDILIAGAALLVLWPVMLGIALAIRLDSKGSVFFVQRRVGLNQRPFSMFKFRSMHEKADASIANLEHLNEAAGPIFKMENDPRVTRVGRWIRRTSLDELPQLFNVLIGDMSVVGPRPMSLRDVGLFSRAIQRRRFSVRPGLACLREVSGRSRLTFDRWLELDLQYIDRWCLMLDFKIMLLLIPVVIKGEGAI